LFAPGLLRLRAFLPGLLGFLTAFFFGFFLAVVSAAFLPAGFAPDLPAGLPLLLLAGFLPALGFSSPDVFFPGILPALSCDLTLAGAWLDLPRPAPLAEPRRRAYLS